MILINCSPQTYHIHIGESFARVNQQFVSSGGSAIDSARPDTIIEVTGIYCGENIFLGRYPVIRIYSREKGKRIVPLSAPLNCSDGNLIHITGKVVSLPVTYSIIKKTLDYNHLNPISFSNISDNQKIIELVNQEYRKIRADLQSKITIEQSKLQLSAEPTWAIWYDESEQLFIFHSHQFDLMYAADIEFIVDAQTKKIKDVYAREWFKGEK